MPTYRLQIAADAALPAAAFASLEAQAALPPAVLTPNLDADARGPLPRRVSVRAPGSLHPAADVTRPAAAGDDELLRCTVHIDPPPSADVPLRLRVSGALPPATVRIYDVNGRILPNNPHQPRERLLTYPAGTAQLALDLEARSLPGAPFGRALTPRTTYVRDGRDLARFMLELCVPETPAAARRLTARAPVRAQRPCLLAPLLFLHHGLPAERLYVQVFPTHDSQSGQRRLRPNLPTVRDLRAALRPLPGVTLIEVPPRPRATLSGSGAGGGQQPVFDSDTWLQDQLALGATIGHGGARTLALHLPRVRANSRHIVVRDNLVRFVQSHFPAQDVGLLDDFWQRSLSLSDANGQMHTLSIYAYMGLSFLMGRVQGLVDNYLALLEVLGGRRGPSIDVERWSAMRRSLPQLQRALDVAWQQARSQGDPSDARSRWLEARVALMQRQLASTERLFPLRGSTITVSTGSHPSSPDTLRFPLAPPVADALFERLHLVSSSANYGGNLLASPPTADAPLGKLVVSQAALPQPQSQPRAPRPGLAAALGDPAAAAPTPSRPEAPESGRDLGDPRSPDREGASGLTPPTARDGSAAMSSVDPEARALAWATAMDPDLVRLLDAQLQPLVDIDTRWLSVGHVDEVLTFVPRQDRPCAHALWVSSPGLAHALLREAERRQGQVPVTRMLRGKLWRHQESISPSGWPRSHTPPRTYVRLSALHAQQGTAAAAYLRYNPNLPIGHLEYHPADISVGEFLLAERDNDRRSSNLAIETGRLAPIRRQLQGAFAELPLIAMPVLFDRVRDTRAPFAVSAFTPNVVNLQVVGSTLLVPRPHGPRLRLNDAIDLLWAVLAPQVTGSALNRQTQASLDDSLRRAELPNPAGAFAGESLAGTLPASALLSRLDPARLQSLGLDRPEIWVLAYRPGAYNDSGALTSAALPPDAPSTAASAGPVLHAAELAHSLRDGQPEMALDALTDALIAENPSDTFLPDGRLSRVWTQLRLPERTVDLFELYIVAAADALGLSVHFIDSWSYHLTHGEIHCGTQVLRRPDADLEQRYWHALGWP